MGRSRESGFEFSSRALKVKKPRVADRRCAVDAKQERHNDRRRMRLSRVEEEVGEDEEHHQQGQEGGRHVKRGRWSIRLRRRKLVTPVVRYLKRFRQTCTSLATIAAAPFRYYKLGIVMAKLHLSRRRNSGKIHSLLTTASQSDEQAPLLPRLAL